MSLPNFLIASSKNSKTILKLVFAKFPRRLFGIFQHNFKNSSSPNFLIASLKYSTTILKLVFAKFPHRLFEIFSDNFKTRLCQISSSPLRNILRQFQKSSLPNFLIASSNYSKTILKLVFAKFPHRLFEIFYDSFKTCRCQIFSSRLRYILRQFQNLSLPNFLTASSKYSKTISKLVFAKFPRRLFGIFQHNFKNSSSPNFLIASLKYSTTILKLVFAKFPHRLFEIFSDNFKTRLCQISSSPLRNILRQFQKSSLPNFLIASSNYSKTILKLVFAKFPHRLFEIFYDSFKTCRCQIFSSPLRYILRQFQNLSLPNFLTASSKYSKTISKLVFAKFPHRLFEIF